MGSLVELNEFIESFETHKTCDFFFFDLYLPQFDHHEVDFIGAGSIRLG